MNDLNRILALAGLPPTTQLLLEAQLDEKSPPGFKGTVKAMKKHKDIDNPWALSWYMKNKGYHSHYTKSGKKKDESVEFNLDAVVETVLQQMDEAEQGWEPISTAPDYGQRIRVRSSKWEGIAACHGYDSGGFHEWHDEAGNRLSSLDIGVPDEWLPGAGPDA